MFLAESGTVRLVNILASIQSTTSINALAWAVVSELDTWFECECDGIMVSFLIVNDVITYIICQGAILRILKLGWCSSMKVILIFTLHPHATLQLTIIFLNFGCRSTLSYGIISLCELRCCHGRRGVHLGAHDREAVHGPQRLEHGLDPVRETGVGENNTA